MLSIKVVNKGQPALVPTLNLLVTYDYYERVFLWITKSNLMITSLAVLSILFYSAAAFMLTGKFFHQQGPNQRAAMIVACLAVGAHIIYLHDVILLEPGQNMSIANVLSLVSCLTTLAMLISSRFLPNLVLLPAVFGFSALSVSAALFIPSSHIIICLWHHYYGIALRATNVVHYLPLETKRRHVTAFVTASAYPS